MPTKFLIYFILFIFIFFFVFRNLILNISTNLLDWRDYPYIIWVIYQNVTHINNLDFANFFETNAFYPNRLTLLFSDILLPQALVLIPFLTLTKKLILSFNLVFVTTFILNFISSFLFWRQIFKKELLAFIGSLLFIFSPFFHLELSHFQMLSYWPFLFCLFFVFKNEEQNNKRYLLLSGVFLAIQFLASVYLAIYLLFVILILYLLKILSYKKVNRSAAFGLMVIFLVFLIFAGIFIKAYVDMKNAYGIKRDFKEYITYSAHLSDYIFTSQIKSLIHQSPLVQMWNRADKNWSLHSSFPGFLLLILSLFGLFKITKDKSWTTISIWLNKEKSFFIILVISGFIFSLGPRLNFNGNYAHIPLPYTAVVKLVPFAEALRVPSRWSFIFFLGITYLALLGLKKFEGKSYYKVLITATLVLFVLEYLPTNITTYSEEYILNNDKALKQLCGDTRKVLLKIPVTHLDVAPDIITGLNYIAKAELASTYHNCLMVNGYSGYDLPSLFNLKDKINDSIAKGNTKAFLKLMEKYNVDIIEFNQLFFLKELREPGGKFIRNLAADPLVTKINKDLFLLQR